MMATIRGLLWLLIFVTPLALTDNKPVSPVSHEADKAIVQKKEQTWWEKRNNRTDLYYPHNAHMKVMEKEGDSCLLCHSFNANKITDLDQLKKLNTIANEPLEGICHSCHVVKLTAPWDCNLCHNDPAEIWPNDHNFDYLNHHAEDARLDESECRTCHIDASFCTDCHFRRDPVQRRVHTMAYRASHGIEARLNASYCSSCHRASYCSDCHRKRR